MPEWPEINLMAGQMNRELKSKTVQSVEVFQEKCLNRPLKQFRQMLLGKSIVGVSPLGKWICIQLTDHYRLFINLGMGGELIYFNSGDRFPEKSKIIVTFSDGSGFYGTLWWFGYFHIVNGKESHPMTDSLGPDPMCMTQKEFYNLLRERRGQIKSFLLNQKRIRGIGNFYIQEILYKAGLHPCRSILTLTDLEIEQLYSAIHTVLSESLRLETSSYELDFYGKKGRYNVSNMAFAYQENGCCPACQTKTEKIKTGSTAQYICPVCQKLK